MILEAQQSLLNKKIYLAPMAGVTDNAFRVLLRELGYKEIFFSEMVSSTGIHYKSEKTFEMLKFVEEELPISVQLFGSNPEYIYEAGEYVSNLENVSAIDFNLGCPAPKVVKNNEGSALMKDLKLTERILTALRKSTNKILSVKMRLGFDEKNINAVEVAKITENCGVNFITVHGRTREQFYSGCADWKEIAKVKQSVKIPVIANGDVKDKETLKKIIEVTNADGVMIGRAAMGNPFIFKKFTDENFIEPTIDERIKIIKRHLELLLRFKGEYIGIREMRKHAAWYTKGMIGGGELRDKINRAESVEDFNKILNTLR